MDAAPVLLLAVAVALGGCGDKKPSKPAARDAATATDARVVEPAPVLERIAETTAFLSPWNQPDAVDKMYAAAHSRFRKAVKIQEMRIFHEDFSAKIGKFVAVKSSQGVSHTNKDGQREEIVRGLVTFERGDAPYELVLSDEQGKPAMVHFKLELPPALQTPPDRDQARATAAAFNQALLAVEVGKIDAASLPKIRGQLATHDADRMRDAVAALGGGHKIETLSDAPCGGATEAIHCFKYRVTGAKGAATIVLTLSAPLGRWRVVNWNFEPEETP